MIKFPNQRSVAGKWVSHQRTAYNLGVLSEERINELERIPGWSWNARIARWGAIYEQLVSFVRENKRLPLQYSKNEHEKVLATWVSNRRRDHRQGKLSQERVYKLKQVPGWCWNALTIAWDSLYDRTLEFVKKNGRLPLRRHKEESGNDSEERILGTWAHTQRGMYRHRKLSQKRIKNLEQIPGWTWSRADQWDLTYEQVLEFVREHKRFPSKNRPKEKSLCFWNSTQRIKKGKLSLERSKKLEQIPGWSWNLHGDNWLAKYKKLAIFVRKKLPSQVSKDPEERILGNWLASQRASKRKGNISRERIVKLERIPGWFLG